MYFLSCVEIKTIIIIIIISKKSGWMLFHAWRILYRKGRKVFHLMFQTLKLFKTTSTENLFRSDNNTSL